MYCTIICEHDVFAMPHFMLNVNQRLRLLLLITYYQLLLFLLLLLLFFFLFFFLLRFCIILYILYIVLY